MFTRILTSVLLMLNLCLWTGNICNGLLLGNASIARGLTCCKKLARHEASRKSWSTKFPLGGEVNHIWPLAYGENALADLSFAGSTGHFIGFVVLRLIMMMSIFRTL